MRVLVTGASGQLGGYLLRELARHDLEIVAWSGTRRGELSGISLQPADLADADRICSDYREIHPAIVIHAGAMASVAECSRVPDRAEQVNVQGTAVLADLTARSGARLIFVSTDLVFDGEKGGYIECDTPSPLSVYSRTKAAAEQAAACNPNSAIVRVSLMYGCTLLGRPSFFDQQIAALRERRPLTLFEDEWRTPLDLATAAEALVTISRSDYVGTLHVGGPERMSRLEMGRRLAACLGLDPSVLSSATRASAPLAEPRPRDTSLDSSRWRGLFPGNPWPRFEGAVQGTACESSRGLSRILLPATGSSWQ